MKEWKTKKTYYNELNFLASLKFGSLNNIFFIWICRFKDDDFYVFISLLFLVHVDGLLDFVFYFLELFSEIPKYMFS